MKQELIDLINKKKTTSPLKSYLWRVELPDLNKQTGGYVDGNFSGNIYDISTRITSITVPSKQIETDKASHANTFWYYAKAEDIGTITLDVMEYSDGLTFEYFDKWRELIASTKVIGTFNSPIKYKRDIKFIRLDSMKNDVIVHTYKNYFVSAITEHSNDYESNSVVKYNVTLTGDDVLFQEKSLPAKVSKSQFLDSINKSKAAKKSILDILVF